ncbi:NADH:UBIQUINONE OXIDOREDUCTASE SUBUNIT-17.2 [Ceraceosorus bombacis]|uniref:NADH dehydrogenase [ubiquinone] 1 alpha subcomplex subunit n=1 Tax=Ceraceosorus bombacis TaxID=401625 RepID=A0A0P1BP89_9BASI|nr:NADH:UBIQUINONE OXIDOREDUCTASE SUBUNIT-17.2 [Ceraceosorus bombacis]
MSHFFRTLAKALPLPGGLGRWRYLVGKDLADNSYYEFPSADGNKDPRFTRRVVKYKEHMDIDLYDRSELPLQWMMWLRHTRRSAPSIQRSGAAQTDASGTTSATSSAHASGGAVQHSIHATRSAPQDQTPRDGRAAAVPTSELGQDSFEGRQPTPDDRVWEASRARLREAGVSDARVPVKNTAAGHQPRHAETDTDGKAGESEPSRQVTEGDAQSEFSGAIQRRADRRAQMAQAASAATAKELERERARRLMAASPLSAFDVTVEGAAEGGGAGYSKEMQQVYARAQAEAREKAEREARRNAASQRREESPQLKPRFGRAVGPDEEWSPEAASIAPRRR